MRRFQTFDQSETELAQAVACNTTVRFKLGLEQLRATSQSGKPISNRGQSRARLPNLPGLRCRCRWVRARRGEGRTEVGRQKNSLRFCWYRLSYSQYRGISIFYLKSSVVLHCTGDEHKQQTVLLFFLMLILSSI